MAGLHPDGAARLTLGPVDAAGRIARPAADGGAAMLVLKDAIQHKDLLSAGMAVGLKHRARGPARQPRHPGGGGGIDDQPLLIGRGHLPRLHQDPAARPTEGCVAGAEAGMLFRIKTLGLWD